MSQSSDQVKKKDCFLLWFLVGVVDLIRKGKDQGKKLGVVSLLFKTHVIPLVNVTFHLITET